MPPGQLRGRRLGQGIALLLWQAPLPQTDAASRIRGVRRRGAVGRSSSRRERPASGELFGVRWTTWSEEKAEALPVETWRGDEDLLAHTAERRAACRSGSSQVRKYCGLSRRVHGAGHAARRVALAGRATTDRGRRLLLRDHAGAGDSSLATNGVVLLRAGAAGLAAGAAALGSTRQLVAGPATRERIRHRWKRVAGAEEALSTEYPFHAASTRPASGCWP